MRHDTNWLDYLRTMSADGRDLSVYASQWAHDVRCVRTGNEHRRVGGSGETQRGHTEWLQVGYTAQLSLQLRGAR